MAERGEWAARVRGICEEYLDTVAELERNRKIGEGIFGLKGGPKDDPCHDRFVEDLTKTLSEFSAEDASAEEACDVLSYLYTMPENHKTEKSAYWMLLAVHGLTLDLIGKLLPSDAAALYDQYAACYPRWERLPVQKQVLAELKKARRSNS